jgi:hypothetical protein
MKGWRRRAPTRESARPRLRQKRPAGIFVLNAPAHFPYRLKGNPLPPPGSAIERRPNSVSTHIVALRRGDVSQAEPPTRRRFYFGATGRNRLGGFRSQSSRDRLLPARHGLAATPALDLPSLELVHGAFDIPCRRSRFPDHHAHRLLAFAIGSIQTCGDPTSSSVRRCPLPPRGAVVLSSTATGTNHRPDQDGQESRLLCGGGSR